MLLWLVGLGNKLVVSRKLLDADDHALAAWIDAARNRGGPAPIGRAAQPVAPPRRVFGRRQ